MNHTPKSFVSKYETKSNVLSNNITIFNKLDLKKNINTIGLWDTGATSSVISDDLARFLQLIPIGYTNVSTAGGLVTNVPICVVNIILPNRVGIEDLQVTVGKLGFTGMLIGMDIIGLGDFSVSNYKGKTTFTFRMPSLAETDYVKNFYGAQATANKIGRNDACFCGSVKKNNRNNDQNEQTQKQIEELQQQIEELKKRP